MTAMPKSHDKIDAVDAAFMRGFGCALAAIWMLHHDGSMVASIMKSNGLTLDSFDGTGLMDNDRAQIRVALAGRTELLKSNSKTPRSRRASPARPVCPRCHSADDLVEATNYGRPTGRRHCRKCNLTLEPEAT